LEIRDAFRGSNGKAAKYLAINVNCEDHHTSNKPISPLLFIRDTVHFHIRIAPALPYQWKTKRGSLKNDSDVVHQCRDDTWVVAMVVGVVCLTSRLIPTLE